MYFGICIYFSYHGCSNYNDGYKVIVVHINVN